MSLPPDVQEAISVLADYAVDIRPDYPAPDKLRAWVAGAVQAQVEDPDHSQVAAIDLTPRTEAEIMAASQREWDRLIAAGWRQRDAARHCRMLERDLRVRAGIHEV